jgi:hypothetical protein
MVDCDPFAKVRVHLVKTLYAPIVQSLSDLRQGWWGLLTNSPVKNAAYVLSGSGQRTLSTYLN